ncbi:MAG TPA: ABC transporter ATP-binding protein [Micromonosporaceae bacterium]
MARESLMTALACSRLTLDYPGVPVLAGIDLVIADGEVMALLGASGSGKTTLIHAVAGFVTPTAGEIRLGGSLVSTARHCVAPERRRVGMVFQNYALWPHMTALDTVAYPLRRAGTAERVARERARELLDRVGVGALAGRTPAEMSGGEQQRVGLARALARDADLYVFDEPSAHLDAHLRMTVLDEFARQRAMSGAAALYATHDASEALAIADRVAVLHDGRLAQVGEPADVYAQPADLHVAQLTGVARMLTAPVELTGPGSLVVTVDSVSTTVPCANALDANGSRHAASGGTSDVRPAGGSRDVRSATLLVRPEWAALGGELPGRVIAVRYHGPDSDHYLETPVGTVVIRSPGTPRASEGDRTTWSLLRCWRM